MPVKDIRREVDISDATFTTGKSLAGYLTATAVKHRPLATDTVLVSLAQKPLTGSENY